MNKQVPPAIVIAAIMIVVLLAVGLLASPSAKSLDEPIAGNRVKDGPVVADFQGKTTDGKTLKLSDYRGKVVLINFWATWCPPCVAEIPDLMHLEETYGPKGFTVIGLSQDETLQIAADYAKQRGMNYPVLLAPEDAAQTFGVRALPTSVLLNRDGKIVWAMEGTMEGLSQYEVVGNEVKRLLK